MVATIPQPTIPARRWCRAAAIETALLAGTAALLLLKAVQGVLAFYIHPRYTGLIVGGAIVLLLVALVRAGAIRVPRETPARRVPPSYALLAVPLLIGLAIPARPLGADALPSAPDALDQPGQGGIPLDGPTRDWNLLQWGTALAIGDRDLTGEEVDVVGFVYRDPARPTAGLIVARYAIVCCIADVKGIGLPVTWKGGANLAPDSWVRVRGTLGQTTMGGHRAPMIIATAVEPVPQPDEPYIYR